MTREEFLRRLNEAARRAIDFARTLVVDVVPDDCFFDLWLIPHSQSEECPRPIVDPPLEKLWNKSQEGRFYRLTAEQIADALWHEGRVPEWIDIGVRNARAGSC